jgi:hypothetical protein
MLDEGKSLHFNNFDLITRYFDKLSTFFKTLLIVSTRAHPVTLTAMPLLCCLPCPLHTGNKKNSHRLAEVRSQVLLALS